MCFNSTTKQLIEEFGPVRVHMSRCDWGLEAKLLCPDGELFATLSAKVVFGVSPETQMALVEHEYFLLADYDDRPETLEAYINMGILEVIEELVIGKDIFKVAKIGDLRSELVLPALPTPVRDADASA